MITMKFGFIITKKIITIKGSVILPVSKWRGIVSAGACGETHEKE